MGWGRSHGHGITCLGLGVLVAGLYVLYGAPPSSSFHPSPTLFFKRRAIFRHDHPELPIHQANRASIHICASELRYIVSGGSRGGLVCRLVVSAAETLDRALADMGR